MNFNYISLISGLWFYQVDWRYNNNYLNCSESMKSVILGDHVGVLCVL